MIEKYSPKYLESKFSEVKSEFLKWFEATCNYISTEIYDEDPEIIEMFNLLMEIKENGCSEVFNSLFHIEDYETFSELETFKDWASDKPDAPQHFLNLIRKLKFIINFNKKLSLDKYDYEIESNDKLNVSINSFYILSNSIFGIPNSKDNFERRVIKMASMKKIITMKSHEIHSYKDFNEILKEIVEYKNWDRFQGRFYFDYSCFEKFFKK